MTAEHQRLRDARERGTPWRKWGPYLRERQWGIARENQAADAGASQELSYEQASSWAYEWGEDGLAGICDEQMRLCFAVALWDGRDRILKERLGWARRGGNLLEQEECIYLDNVPTHSYMRVLYKYSECFDVFVEYAKASPEEILIRITIDNRSQKQPTVHVVPTLWFRNTWHGDSSASKPLIERGRSASDECLVARHPIDGTHYLQFEAAEEVLYTNNETNVARFFDRPNPICCVKDGISDYIVNGVEEAVEVSARGTKAAVRYELVLAPGESRSIRLKLGTAAPSGPALGSLRFDSEVRARRREADEFYAALTSGRRDVRLSRTFRSAFAAALWSKQTYLYDISGWLYDRRDGNDASSRNRTRFNVTSSVVLALPDKWRSLRFGTSCSILHALALTRVDADLALSQLESLLSADHMEGVANGSQEDGCYDTSLHAWSALLMYRLQRSHRSHRALIFLRHAYNLLRIREVDRTWAALHEQSMFEIAVELALVDSQYENDAIERYLRFVSIIGRIDVKPHVNTHVNVQGGVPKTASGGQIASVQGVAPIGLISVCAAALLPDTMCKGLPGLVEYVHALTKGNAGPFKCFQPLRAGSINGRRVLSIIDECTLRGLLARLTDQQEASDAGSGSLCTVLSAVVLVRALLCLHNCYGDALRVSAAPGSERTRSLLELSRDTVNRMSSRFEDAQANTKADRLIGASGRAHWGELIPFYEYVYSENSDNIGRPDWAGFIAPLLCRAFGYQTFARTSLHPSPQLRIAYQRHDTRAGGETGFAASRFGC